MKRLEDVRAVLDEAAERLSGAMPRLRPLLAAERDGETLSPEPTGYVHTLGRQALTTWDDDR